MLWSLFVLWIKLPKLSLKCLCPPGPPSSPPDYFSLPLMKKPWYLRLICPGWISDFSFLSSLFIFFSFSVCLSMVYEVNEVHDSKGWSLEGWGILCSRMTRLVRCMCARSLSSNIKCYRSSSFHIFRWLLHIIHSSQLLFQASWLTQLPSRFWIGVNSQRFLSVLACSTW